MTAFEELRDDGVPGRATFTLLISLIRQLGAMTSFPPPNGFPAWSPAAAESYIADLLLAKNGAGFIVQCAVKAHDQPSLERLLLTAIKNALIDEAKATPVGRMRRRMQRMLKTDARFVDARPLLAQDGWTLPENEATVWVENLDDLLRLTASVRVAPIERLNRAGPTPPGARDSLLTLSFESLRLAAGAIRTQALARVLVTRFDLDRAASASHDGASGEAAAEATDPETLDLARHYFDALTDEERVMLRDPGAIGAAAARDARATDLVVRLRAWAGSERGRAAVGLVLTWCASKLSKSGRQ